LILGLVQGLTEFMPISSSGHLVVFKELFTLPDVLKQGARIEVALHGGTLISVLIFYREDVRGIVRYALGRSRTEMNRMDSKALLVWIVIGSVPAVCLGYFFKDWFEFSFENPILVGAALCLTGLVCLSTRWIPRGKVHIAHLGVFRSLCVGLAQGLAIISGISRSGATIVAAMGFGVIPQDAARYSFLLSIPAVAGACVYKACEVGGAEGIPMAVFSLGIMGSALMGLLCLWILNHILRAGYFFYFGFYCIPLGGIVIFCFH
jgi:undecaprenyl-diphosphatase